MNIKRIIREEMEGWEWAEGDEDIYKAYSFDPPINTEIYLNYVAPKLESLGVEGWGGDKRSLYNTDNVKHTKIGHLLVNGINDEQEGLKPNTLFWGGKLYPSRTSHGTFVTDWMDEDYIIVDGYELFGIPKNINESEDPWAWVHEVKILNIGDVFHTRTDFTPNNLNAEITFEIYDISPDGKWVRYTHHKGSMRRGTYIDINKINVHTIGMGWDKSGYNASNSIDMSQALENINSGFWKKVEVPGYLDEHPEDKDKIIKLGVNKLNESEQMSHHF